MEKQVHSNAESVHQTRYNKTTVFLTKFIFGDNFEILKNLGYVDSFIDDEYITEIEDLTEYRYLFLVFKNKKMSVTQIENILKSLIKIPIKFLISYELIDDLSIVCVDFPHGYGEDYKNFIAGRYSKLSESFKNGFPVSIDVKNENGKRIGKEYTLYYQVFNKTEWLKEFWCKRLNLVELDDSLELWQKPDKKDLIFNIKDYIKTK